MTGPAPLLRVVVAEDSAPQRRLLVEMLAGEPDVRVVAEATNGAEAVDAIARHDPDVLFLDVQMPELDAFEIIDEVGADRLPLTIFVTAYDAYALRAFEVHAIDYLLKPFDEERLAGAVRHARRILCGDQREHRGGVTTVLRAVRSPVATTERLTVRVGDRFVFLDTGQIEWIEASGKWVVLHVGKQTLATRELMSTIELRLDTSRFVRVHRSAIVNVGRIQEVQPWFKGDYVIILRNGARIRSGRSYREVVRRLIAR